MDITGTAKITGWFNSLVSKYVLHIKKKKNTKKDKYVRTFEQDMLTILIQIQQININCAFKHAEICSR